MTTKLNHPIEVKLALKQLGRSSKDIGLYVEEWKRVLNDQGNVDLDYEFKQVMVLSDKLGDQLLELHHKLNYLEINRKK